MRRGRKAASPAEHYARGTLRKDRHSALGLIGGEVAAGSLPVKPDDLAPEAEVVWLDNISRVATAGTATELDSDLFINYCRLQGAIVRFWSQGIAPSAAVLVEARRMQELLGLAGASSRLGQPGAGAGTGKPNAFTEMARRRMDRGQ